MNEKNSSTPAELQETELSKTNGGLMSLKGVGKSKVKAEAPTSETADVRSISMADY